MKSLSLKWKVLLGVTLTSMVAVIVASVVSVATQIQHIEKELERFAHTLDMVIGGSVAGALSFDDRDTARDILASLKKSERINAAVIYAKNGKPFAWYEKGKGTDAKAAATSAPRQLTAGMIDHDNPLEFRMAEAIVADGETLGHIYLAVSRDEVAIAEQEALQAAFWSVLVISVFAAIVSLFISRLIVRPVVGVSLALRDMSDGSGDLTLRLPDDGKDEIAVLCRNFNMFIERLHGTISGFSDNAMELDHHAGEVTKLASDTERGV
ncbi:MAG: HAMP domain-containing protein, partial [Cellvibrionaceae bacterium]|nr:HAMP domain-containing protein [Cellvibrionaceae bacterium]